MNPRLPELGVVSVAATTSATTAAEVAAAAPDAFGHALGALFGTLAFAGYVAHRAPDGQALRRTAYKVVSGMCVSFFGALVITPLVLHYRPHLEDVSSGAVAGTIAICSVVLIEVAHAVIRRRGAAL